VLVDSGATYNLFSQSITDKLGLEAVKVGKKRDRKKMPPSITTVSGELLVRYRGRMADGTNAG
jgi:hypothetical protein